MVRFGASHAVGSYYYPVLAVISTGLMACPLAHPTNSSTAHCSCCSIIEKIRRRRIFFIFSVREKNKKMREVISKRLLASEPKQKKPQQTHL
jgi:hypothetical protein